MCDNVSFILITGGVSVIFIHVCRWLDMNELKRGNEVEYEVPDVNENYPGRDVEIRVYLLRAFQISPTQVMCNHKKQSFLLRISSASPKICIIL